MKKLTKILAGIEALAALCIAGAITIWAPVCQKMLLLENGNETHMKCFFSGRAALALALVLLTLALVTFFARKDHKLIQLGALVTSAMVILVFTVFIGVCAKSDMACHGTAAWCEISAAAAGLCALVDIVGGREGQLPE